MFHIKKWFRGVRAWWFSSNTPLVVEVEKRFNENIDDEESVRSLINHPGFVTLMNRKRLQKAALRAKLEQPQDTLRDYDRLQLGIYWIGYDEAEVNRAIAKKSEVRAALAKPYEKVEFDKVFALYESV